MRRVERAGGTAFKGDMQRPAVLTDVAGPPIFVASL